MPRAVVMTEAPKEGSFLDKCHVEMNKKKPVLLAGNEVLVEMKCRSVNPADVMVLKGQYADFHPEKFPATIGLEGCGTVAEVGDSVEDLKVGDRVQPFIAEDRYFGNGEGSWQDFVRVKDEDLVKVPDDIPDEFAAQAFVNPWTVMGICEVLEVPKGEFMLISAASSAMGKELVSYAHKEGVTTICIVRHDDAKEELKKLGAHMVLNSQTEDVFKMVMDATKCKGVYAAIDPVCGEMTKMLAHCTRNNGTVLVFGNLCGADIQVSPMDLIFRNVRIEGFLVMRWMHKKYADAKARNKLCNKVFDLYKEGVFRPPVGEKFQLQEFDKAVNASLHEGKPGTILLVS